MHYKFYMVNNGNAIMGKYIFPVLYLQISEIFSHNSSGCPFSTNVSPFSNTSMGCAKNSVHKIKVHSDVKPVYQKLRCLPFSNRKVVSQELKKILEQDVIEKN